MVVRKMMKAWKLSDDDKKAIKKNTQKIKDFLTLKKADTCTEFYNWCDYYDHDFLGYIENFLPFIKEEWKYISKSDIKDLIHEIDLVIRDVKNTSLSTDDFDDEDDIIEFVIDKYSKMDLLKMILEHGDKELINKLINNEGEDFCTKLK